MHFIDLVIAGKQGFRNLNSWTTVGTDPRLAMKTLKYLSFVGKIAGFVTALGSIPFVDPKVGIIVFAAASLLKDSVNRI